MKLLYLPFLILLVIFISLIKHGLPEPFIVYAVIFLIAVALLYGIWYALRPLIRRKHAPDEVLPDGTEIFYYHNDEERRALKSYYPDAVILPGKDYQRF